MRTESDLTALKNLAKALLHLDIQPTEYAPIIVKHPFTDSGIVGYRTVDGRIEQADITKDTAALSEWQDSMP